MIIYLIDILDLIKSVGGFGIGLNIVSLIAKEYDFKIEVSSQIDVGTKVKIRW